MILGSEWTEKANMDIAPSVDCDQSNTAASINWTDYTYLRDITEQVFEIGISSWEQQLLWTMGFLVQGLVFYLILFAQKYLKHLTMVTTEYGHINYVLIIVWLTASTKHKTQWVPPL